MESSAMEEFEEVSLSEFDLNIGHVPELRTTVGMSGFLEYLVHHLIYVKNIFPKEAFAKSQRNGVPLWLCKYPDVMNYVFHFLDYASASLMTGAAIEITFALTKGENKNVLEKHCFELKPNDSCVESGTELKCHLDDLVAICEDIQKTNTFTGNDTVNSKATEVSFELGCFPKNNVKLPGDDPDENWVRYPVYPKPASTSERNLLEEYGASTSEGSCSKKITPLKNQRNKKLEIAAYVLKIK